MSAETGTTQAVLTPFSGHGIFSSLVWMCSLHKIDFQVISRARGDEVGGCSRILTDRFAHGLTIMQHSVRPDRYTCRSLHNWHTEIRLQLRFFLPQQFSIIEKQSNEMMDEL